MCPVQEFDANEESMNYQRHSQLSGHEERNREESIVGLGPRWQYNAHGKREPVF